MIDEGELRRFLVDAHQHGYASGQSAPSRKEADGSTTIEHVSGAWTFHDSFFGGEPYGGREVVSKDGKPVWMMVYYGRVVPTVGDVAGIYRALQGALRQVSLEAPFRGPRTCEVGDCRYENKWSGDLKRFTGRETITRDGVEVYEADYSGGLVDVRGE